MNPLLQKELRLLRPAWSVAMLLALAQTVSRPNNFYIASLLVLGLAIMALTTMGREVSLNTFSSLLAQPAERQRIWQVKLSVLAGAFLSVLAVWLVGETIACLTTYPDVAGQEIAYYLFIAAGLVGMAAFTGGLWTTLLLRQLAGAFWLTLLVPAILSGGSVVFLAGTDSDNLVIAVLSVIVGVYSLAGFFFARWLFYRAQDVGWSGGVIALPDWNLFAHATPADSPRQRKPFRALLKKEWQLHQASLTGAAGLLCLHLGVIALRKYHHFAPNSAGEELTSIFWLLWLILPPVIGSMAVAEERRLGVLEGQFCLPVSRRRQFILKLLFTLGLGIFLGGLMPLLLEDLSTFVGAGNPAFKLEPDRGFDAVLIHGVTLLGVAWLTLLSFFASTLSRNFLQAVGLGIATCFISTTLLAINGQDFFHGFMAVHSALPVMVAAPTLIVILLWLAYWNYQDFRPGWPLWRRNLLGFAGAFAVVIVLSINLYYRAWEVLEPAEPAHGPAKMSLANPPVLQQVEYQNVLARLPDGRVWFDTLSYPDSTQSDTPLANLTRWLRMIAHPLPESAGPQQFLDGSNWVAATTKRMYFGWKENGKQTWATDYMDTVGIQPDGTLWLAAKPQGNQWEQGIARQYGNETNWSQLAQARYSVVLLKTDGTLWRWGCLTNDFYQWPGLRTFTPYQIGTNSDWQGLFSRGRIFVQQVGGRAWRLDVDWKTGRDELIRETNYDELFFPTASHTTEGRTAFVRADGTLCLLNRYWDEASRQMKGSGVLQVGSDTDWRAVAISASQLIALRADGSLWQWRFGENWNLSEAELRAVTQAQPRRLGIHNDWVALTWTWDNVIALAADGSLWLWPDRDRCEQYTLLKLPKQPKLLGNVFDQAKH